MPLADESAAAAGQRPMARGMRPAEFANGESQPEPAPAGATGESGPSQRCGTFGQSFRCACRGVGATVLSQRNLRLQAGIAASVIVAGLLLGLTAGEWAAIVLAMAGVFTAEITNTAIEAIVDLVSPGYSELARIAKDAAAGATLVAAGASVIVGLLTLGPHLLRLLTH
jgi:diacylglycerol kinase